MTAYLWGELAVLTCPCHLLILAVVLAGTTPARSSVSIWVIAALGLTDLFLLSLSLALRASGP
ncbi:broad-spectrum mercury transporter MerE [Acidithiobacillus ferridurans]|nr:broad-spectrum mercury transporter MerE [Acidithiobacillus ferridurans]